MRLEIASKKAIDYACKRFHYAKVSPVVAIWYSVFEDDVWCGCITYWYGANQNMWKEFWLKQGEVFELTRMALNGKQSTTSKALSLSLKMIKKHVPLIKLIISYADKDQNHMWVVYQASNRYYLWNAWGTNSFMINGKKTHPRSVYWKCKQSITEIRKHIDPNASVFVTKWKHKYIYILDKNIYDGIKSKIKPYPNKILAEVV